MGIVYPSMVTKDARETHALERMRIDGGSCADFVRVCF